jgi:hypothetical protein
VSLPLSLSLSLSLSLARPIFLPTCRRVPHFNAMRCAAYSTPIQPCCVLLSGPRRAAGGLWHGPSVRRLLHRPQLLVRDVVVALTAAHELIGRRHCDIHVLYELVCALCVIVRRVRRRDDSSLFAIAAFFCVTSVVLDVVSCFCVFVRSWFLGACCHGINVVMSSCCGDVSCRDVLVSRRHVVTSWWCRDRLRCGASRASSASLVETLRTRRAARTPRPRVRYSHRAIHWWWTSLVLFSLSCPSRHRVAATDSVRVWMLAQTAAAATTPPRPSRCAEPAASSTTTVRDVPHCGCCTIHAGVLLDNAVCVPFWLSLLFLLLVVAVAVVRAVVVNV